MLGPQFQEHDDEGPYCPNCTLDMGDYGESMEYWTDMRPKIKPEDRLACKGCGVR